MNTGAIQKFMSLHQSLMTLAHSDGFIEHNREYKVQSIVQACAEQLKASRVSIWNLSEDQSTISCEQLYNRSNKQFESGIKLFEKDFPNYFNALKQSRLIDANDARTDIRTSEFTEPYLKPLGIFSLLDAPIFLKGQLYGVLCIEQTDNIRVWDLAELSYATTLADTISLSNEHESWLSAQEEMAHIVRNDHLTGLSNRRFIQETIDKDLNGHQSQPCSLILLGLDSFTTVNDTYGQHGADHVLSYLGVQFEALAQQYKMLSARISGDIFGFWFKHVDSAYRDDIIAEFKKLMLRPISLPLGKELTLTASIGVVTTPQDDIHLQDPIRCGEVALKKAKSKAKGSVVYFDSQWLSEIQTLQGLKSDLLQAFVKRQLIAHYQPLISSSNQQVVGIEALVRWQHPDKGLIAPFKFLPLAAEMGLMCKLGDFMLQQACEDMQRLSVHGVTIQWVSVNLSSEQLYDSRICEKIEDLLKRYNLPSSALELEVVEELISQESEMVKAQLDAIDKLGIRLAIDDFGTGYSSLSRLKHLPVSKLKIDKSFVDGLPDSEEDRCIARSIIGLAKGIKVDLVAEGVENLQQAEWLIENGVDYLQGYYYAKPLPFDQLVEFCLSKQKEKIHKTGHYCVERHGDLIELIATYHWDTDTALEAVSKINKLSESFCGKPWATLVDTRLWQVNTLDVQNLFLQGSEEFVKNGLLRSAFIVSDSDLSSYQLELMTPESENYQHRFFHDKNHAMLWLQAEGFDEFTATH